MKNTGEILESFEDFTNEAKSDNLLKNTKDGSQIEITHIDMVESNDKKSLLKDVESFMKDIEKRYNVDITYLQLALGEKSN